MLLALLTSLTSLDVVRNETFYDFQEHNECIIAKNKIKLPLLASLTLTTEAQRKATKSPCLFPLSFD